MYTHFWRFGLQHKERGDLFSGLNELYPRESEIRAGME